MRFLLLTLTLVSTSFGYSVLSHEAIVDAVWSTDIRPALLARFPTATPQELKKAHAYAYGGCLIQDLGYAPFSSKTFSNLVHYVRSGDFVAALIGQAASVNELAFGYGSLAHYAADRTGHPIINRIEPMVYPKLARRYGAVVTYEDDKARHLETEFSLDVIQVARGSYAPEDYHDFIGFEISQGLLERAFESTYGFPLKELLGPEDLSFGTFRFAAGTMIPEMTRVAWISKRKDIEKLAPGITRERFVYSLPRSKYAREWGTSYRRPGFLARILALLVRLMPSVGPLRALHFKPVPAQGEQMFLASFQATLADYRRLIAQTKAGSISLPDINLDTGSPSRFGDYELAGSAWVALVDRLAKAHFQSMNPELRADIFMHFAEAKAPLPAKTQAQLAELRAQDSPDAIHCGLDCP